MEGARCSSWRGFEPRCRHVKPGGWKDQILLSPVEDWEAPKWILHQMSFWSAPAVVPRSELVAHAPPGSSEFRTSGTLRSRREVLTVDSEITAPASPVAAGMAVDDVPSTIVDALEMDLSPVSSTVPASLGAVRRTGRTTPHLRRVVLMPRARST